jgi:hypothetical protein
LNLARSPIDLALGLELLVAGELAGLFLDLTFCPLGGAFDPIPYHRLLFRFSSWLSGWETSASRPGLL